MSTAKDAARKAIEVINRSGGQTARSTALLELIAGVEAFVKKADADRDLAKELPQLIKEQKDLEVQIKNEEDSRIKNQLQREYDDTKSIVVAADKARREVDTNKAIIAALEAPAEQLIKAIRKARN